MTKATNLEELQRLVKKVTGKDSEADSIADAICELAEGYSGGGGGGGISVVEATLYPDSNDVITNGILKMSDGSTVDIKVSYIPEFDITSNEGANAGTTKLTVDNTLASGNSYVYTFDRSPSLPAIGEDVSMYTVWNGTSDIECEDGAQITLIEVNANKKAAKAGTVAAIIKY